MAPKRNQAKTSVSESVPAAGRTPRRKINRETTSKGQPVEKRPPRDVLILKSKFAEQRAKAMGRGHHS